MIGVIAVQRRADLILQIDVGYIEAATPGDRERVGDVERVECIESGILIGGTKRDRTDRNRIAGLAEENSTAADYKVWTDRAEFGAGRKIRHA
jgi:hypothetical protein